MGMGVKSSLASLAMAEAMGANANRRTEQAFRGWTSMRQLLFKRGGIHVFHVARIHWASRTDSISTPGTHNPAPNAGPPTVCRKETTGLNEKRRPEGRLSLLLKHPEDQ
jgi:hypothetical protein